MIHVESTNVLMPIMACGGADFAAELRGRLFEVSDHEFNLLYRACEGHTHERTHPDITIQTCWDSDRLDLGRVGITPHPGKLCTDAARTKEIIQWADGRASFRVVPNGVVPFKMTLQFVHGFVR